jgi:hypothetical protein
VLLLGVCWSCFEEGMEIDEKKSKVQMVIGFLYKMVLQKPYTPFSQSYELGCFSSMFVVVVVVACLSVCLFV